MRAAWHRGIVVIAALAALTAAAPAAAQAPAGRLVLYTSQPERDAAQTVNAFKKVNPGVEVEVFRSGTTEVMGKLAAEFAGGASKADVLLLADAATMESLKKSGRLLAYPQANVAGLDPGSYDADKTYFGSKLITTGIAYNTAAKNRPTSFADLAKPEYKDQLTMPSPLYSGAAAIMLGTMVTRPDLGWTWFEKLKAADTVAVRGNGAVLTAVANGESGTGWRQRTQEMFVPLVHPPGHAQADFGEAIGIDRRERGDVLSVAPGVRWAEDRAGEAAEGP